MYSTNSILLETASFSAKMFHHEERHKSSTENLPNFTNTISYSIEAGNGTSTFKYATSKPERLEFVEATRKKTCAHEIEKHWTLVRRRELNRNNATMYIWSFKRKRAPYGRLIKQKAHVCTHGGMQQCGVNYWETYSPVVNWMSVIEMLTLSILRYLHTKSVYSVLDYTQADVKIEIFMELLIGFGV